MGLPATKREQHFTYQEYLAWPEDERWELIDGVAYLMSAPTLDHQALAGEIFRQMANFLLDKPCKVFMAPIEVLLPRADEEDQRVDTVVQPDVAVFCHAGRLREKNARGAPDLAVEVLSPSTMKKDLNEKFAAFERSGVREYWVVDPAHRTLMAYVRFGDRFGDGRLYAPDEGQPRGTAESTVLEGFALDLDRVFAG